MKKSDMGAVLRIWRRDNDWPQKEKWDEKRCAELKAQIGKLELSVQRAQESIDAAGERSNDPTLVDIVRKEG